MKAKRLILISVLCVFILTVGIFALTSCNEEVCQHRDADDDSLCDKCGEAYTDGKDVEDEPTPCQHRDADDDSLCDKCGEAYTDGKDVEDEHVHSFTVQNTDSTYLASEATCTAKATYYYSCVCGAKGSYTFTDGTEKDHTYKSTGYCGVCNRLIPATEGVIYDSSADGSYAEVIGYSGTDKVVVIAKTYKDLPVKGIYKEAFKNMSIKEVCIPDSVTNIGYMAFYNCDSLTSVTIGNSVTTIDNSAFEDCTSLTSVTIPDSVTTIGPYAFSGCRRLKSITIGDGVTSIGALAFENCARLKSITIPDSVTSIGDYAFRYCSSLTSVTIGNCATNIGEGAFKGCNSALYTEYENGRYVGDSVNPYAVLIELTNKNLSSYKINDKTKIIADGVFSDCDRLSTVVIPNSVTSIGERAFRYCSSLTSVTIGNSVTTIGSSAFYDCSSLTSITIPDSVTSIDNGAFSGCSSLTSVYIRDIAKWCSISFGDLDANPIKYAGNLYLNGKLVTELVIPDGVTSIGNYAFQYCSSLTSVTIPDSVTSIGNGAFESCSSLTSVTIGNSVTSIGSYAFEYCRSLKEIKYRGTEAQWEAISKRTNWDRGTGDYTITYNYTEE